VLAEVESGDSGPGVPGSSSLVTEGSGGLVPVSVMSRSSIADVAGASPSHPDTAGLMGATLRAPIASCPQMLGSIGAAYNPDVLADVVQPPHPPVVDDTPSGYPEDSGTIGMPDIADIYRDFNVDVMPLASTSVSGVDVTSYPDLSVAASMSAATSGARREIRNPSIT